MGLYALYIAHLILHKRRYGRIIARLQEINQDQGDRMIVINEEMIRPQPGEPINHNSIRIEEVLLTSIARIYN